MKPLAIFRLPHDAVFGLGVAASVLGGFLLTLCRYGGLPTDFSRYVALEWLCGCAFCFFLFAIAFFRLDKVVYDDNRFRYRAALLCILILPCLFALLIHSQLYIAIEPNLIPLHSDVYVDRGIYPEMLDAWLKGQLHLDLPIDPEPLLSLRNPYEWYERSAYEIVYPWDRAFFDGKFYSYFGVAPLFLLHLPVYAFTGMVASETFSCFYFCILAILAIAWLLWELCQKALGKVPLLLYGIAVFSLPFASLFFLLQSAARFYQIALLCAIACLCAALAAFLRGCRTDRPWKRNVWFFLAGLLVALTAASRPHYLLYALLLLPFAWEFLKKDLAWRNKGIAVLCFALPVAIGGALLMLHNALRFGSPFEFGSSYQLTLFDMRVYGGIASNQILPALYHYFLQKPEVLNAFPYYRFSYEVMRSQAAPFYLNATVGALRFPLTWGMLSPFLWVWDGDRRKRFVLPFAILGVLLAFGVAFLNTCLAGVHERYLCDFLFLLALLGFFGLLLLHDAARRAPLRFGAVALMVVLCVLSVRMGLWFTIENESALLKELNTPFYRFLQQWFSAT